MIKIEQSEVRIDHIDFNDRSYIFTYDPPLSPLITSIKQIGIVNAPVLEQKSEATYRIVAGLKRILAFKQLKENKLRATIHHSETGEPDYRMFLFTLYENLGTRTLNVIEKANVLYKLSHRYHISKDTIIKKFLPLLDLGENPQVIDRYLKLVELEDYLKLSILEDFISIDMAVSMQNLSQPERQVIFQLFQELKLGKNQQKEFFRLLQDLSASSKQPVAMILSAEPIKAILSDDRLTSGQKMNKIKENLLKLRYPRFSKTEDAFGKLKRELRLPPGISFHPPPFFEGNNYRIDFSFKNAADFEKIIKILNSIAAEHKLEKLDRLVE
jgi:ParB-like chromosome segregation protein Spo0J